jgi:hypothetical protein
MTKEQTNVIYVTISLACSLGCCGGDDKDEGGNDSTPTTLPSTPTPTPTTPTTAPPTQGKLSIVLKNYITLSKAYLIS